MNDTKQLEALRREFAADPWLPAERLAAACDRAIASLEAQPKGAKACAGFRCSGYDVDSVKAGGKHDVHDGLPDWSECRCICGLGYSACMASRATPENPRPQERVMLDNLIDVAMGEPITVPRTPLTQLAADMGAESGRRLRAAFAPAVPAQPQPPATGDVGAVPARVWLYTAGNCRTLAYDVLEDYRRDARWTETGFVPAAELVGARAELAALRETDAEIHAAYLTAHRERTELQAELAAARAPVVGVYQSRFGAPEGNCYQAAIATVLGVPLEEVPDYDRTEEAKNWPDYCVRLGAWLNERGLSLRAFGTFADGTPFVSAPNGTLVMVGGPSPRGDFDHIVVARKEEAGLVWHHDPHPDGTFVASPRWVEFIVPHAALLPASLPRPEQLATPAGGSGGVEP
jgi:hypothetical protein